MAEFDYRKSSPMPPEIPGEGLVFNANRCGAGDVLQALGFVRGYRSMDLPSHILTVRDDHRQLLSVFGESPTQTHDGPTLELGSRNPIYRSYIEEASREGITYSSHMQRTYPHNPPWIAPDSFISPEDLAWASGIWDKIEGDRRIVVNPWAAWTARNYAEHSYWDLMWELTGRGWKVLLIGRSEDDIKGAPYGVWGTTWPMTAALFQGALVIGNDSGPVHLAGSLGVPAIAVCGPTWGQFDRYPSVLELSLDGACSGCWFKRDYGFRSACDRGCRMLGELPVESIVEAIENVYVDGVLRPDRLHQPGPSAGPMAGLPAEVGQVPTINRAPLCGRWLGAARSQAGASGLA